MKGELQRKPVDPIRLGEIVIAKWKEDILTEGFVPLPKKLLRVMPEVFGKDGIIDLAVVLAVVDFKRPRQSMMPSLDYLAFIAGLSRSVFWERLRALEARGFITIGGDQDNLKVEIDGLLAKVEELAAGQDSDEDREVGAEA